MHEAHEHYFYAHFCANSYQTSGSWNVKAIETIQEIGRRVTMATNESLYLFQRLSVAIQRGNAASFLNTFPEECGSHLDHYYNFNIQFLACGLCAGGH